MVDNLAAVTRLDRWKQAAYDELRLIYGERLTFRRWSKLFYKYYMSYLNADSSQWASIVSVYITSIASEVNGDYATIEAAFDRATQNVKEQRRGSTDFQWLEKKLSTEMVERLTIPGVIAYRSLITRYALTGISNGLFLSVPPIIYKKLQRSNKLRYCLEAYASPFNHTLPDYCSLFDDDRDYGALGRYEEYISRLDRSARLCINPPYVGSVITTAIKVTLDYVKRVRGEFVFITPVMPDPDFPPYEELKNHPGVVWSPLVAGTYTMYNHVYQHSIIAPMDLLIFCYFGSESQTYLTSLLKALATGVSEHST